ncbi:MAG TPA: hypothetical protein PLS50_09330, partial [Candidatus Dojkabacteria bacterium]|nr:hypothetical protein [Candidatus Dojkabacteria bacterium]
RINDLFYGGLWNIQNGGNPASARVNGDDYVEFLAAADVGDFIEVSCDGTYWYAEGQSGVAGGIQ